MVLQRAEGLSDREAVDRFSFDLRWKYAAGGLDFDHEGFVHTCTVTHRQNRSLPRTPRRSGRVSGWSATAFGAPMVASAFLIAP